MSRPSRAKQDCNIHLRARQFIRFAEYADHILQLGQQHQSRLTNRSRRLEAARLKLTAEDLRLASVVAYGDDDGDDDVDDDDADEDDDSDEFVRRTGDEDEECWPIKWEDNVNSIGMTLVFWRNACRVAGYAVSSHEGQLKKDEADNEERNQDDESQQESDDQKKEEEDNDGNDDHDDDDDGGNQCHVRRRRPQGLRLQSAPDAHIDLAASPSLRVIRITPYVVAWYFLPSLLVALIFAGVWYILLMPAV